MTGKLYNAGQTCVAPDYVLVPAGSEAAFEAEARRVVGASYPASSAGSDYTRVVDAAHYERLRALVSEAEAEGARIVALGAEAEAADDTRRSPDAGRVIAPTLVFHPTDDMRLMQEEIFGPVLPVLAYDTLEAAIDFVRARPHPLALYYFDEDRRRVDHLLEHTLSGGVTVGDCVFHLAQRRLPFGGVGASGMGQYRGFDGFVTFSKKRGVMVQRRRALTSLFRPPYDGRTRTIVRWLMRLAGR
jgi:coniferyl-aldehyde dehydrogenase